MSSARTSSARPAARGVVYLHCCPSALAPHVEWALAGVLASPVRLEWAGQPAAPQHLRAEAEWIGAIGTAGRLAAALRTWPMLIFEVTENATSVTDGERLAYVPGRGFHRRSVSASGDVVVGEERLRALLARARSAEDYEHGLHELLGLSWDAELEPYRLGGDGAPVTLLHQVG
jgi:hypothetical protein